jgi:ATP adenylyltransferase
MVTSHPECSFCQIVRGHDSQARVVYRDQRLIAFLPPEPATLGHTLVVPCEHIPNVWSLEPEMAGWMAQAVVDLAKVVKQSVQPAGLNIIQSNGEAATQTVPHLHVHIVPRWDSDAMGPIWPSNTSYSEEQKDSVWRRLRNEMDATFVSGAHDREDAEIAARHHGPDLEDKRKHLDFIQSVVSRMSAASAMTKSWLLPIVTATYGYALVGHASSIGWLGLMAVALFALMDANYLNQERAFRRLYDAVSSGIEVQRFSLNPALAAPAKASIAESDAPRIWRRVWSRIRNWFPGRAVWSSWAIAPFYGGLFVAGVLIVWFFA